MQHIGPSQRQTGALCILHTARPAPSTSRHLFALQTKKPVPCPPHWRGERRKKVDHPLRSAWGSEPEGSVLAHQGRVGHGQMGTLALEKPDLPHHRSTPAMCPSLPKTSLTLREFPARPQPLRCGRGRAAVFRGRKAVGLGAQGMFAESE